MEKTMKNKIKILIVFITLLVIGIIIFLFLYNQESFKGSRIKNLDSYMLDIERMHGTDQHTLDLQKGDVLQIQFETVKGSMDMEIKAPDGTIIYSGNGKETTDFTVNISESGTYTVVVEASHAEGTIHIQRGKNE